MSILHGNIIDGTSGERIDAKVHVLNSRGQFAQPNNAILKNGPGTSFFFCNGEFEVRVNRGRTDVLVERGTEYEPARVVVEMPENGSLLLPF